MNNKSFILLTLICGSYCQLYLLMLTPNAPSSYVSNGIVYNEASYHLNCTCTSCPTQSFAAGISSYNFDGISNWVNCDSGAPPLQYNFTISIWVFVPKNNESVPTNRSVWSIDDRPSGSDIFIGLFHRTGQDTTNSFYFTYTGCGVNETRDYFASDDKLDSWWFITVVQDLFSLNVYVNATLFSSHPRWGCSIDLSTFFRVGSTSQGNYFKGNIHSVRFWLFTELNQSAILQIYNSDIIAAIGSKESNNEIELIEIVIPVGVGIIIIGLISFGIIYSVRKNLKKKTTQEMTEISKKSNTSEPEKTNKPPSREVYLHANPKSIIGEGNFGTVYKGEWQGINVAMKKLKDPSEFEKEMKNLKNLGKHPNVISYFGISIDDKNEKYLVMEYIERGSLRNFLLDDEEKIFPFEDLFDLIIGTCKGMLHLEHNNIIHRDLAARNLLILQVNGRWTVKVSDFGMARELNNYYTSSTVMPVRWTAPEVLIYNKYYKESDVWSFGVTSWEILTGGKEPYSELSSNEKVVQEVTSGVILKKPENCSEKLWMILSKCFEDRSTRPNFESMLSLLTDYGRNSKLNMSVATEALTLSLSLSVSNDQRLSLSVSNDQRLSFSLNDQEY